MRTGCDIIVNIMSFLVIFRTSMVHGSTDHPIDDKHFVNTYHVATGGWMMGDFQTHTGCHYMSVQDGGSIYRA